MEMVEMFRRVMLNANSIRGKLDRQAWPVGVDVDRSSSTSELDVDQLEEEVVVDVQVANCVQHDTIQIVQLGVGDYDAVCGRDAIGEGKLLKRVKSLPLERLDARQNWERKSRHDCQAFQNHVSANFGQTSSPKTSHVDSVKTCQIATNFLDFTEVDITGG